MGAPPKNINFTYLPLRNTSCTTKVANEVCTSWDIRQIKSKGLAGLLVYNDKGELLAIAPSVDTPCIGVGVGEIDLGGVITEVCAISEIGRH